MLVDERDIKALIRALLDAAQDRHRSRDCPETALKLFARNSI